MQINTREFFCSTNGDKWFLRHDLETDRVYVRHVANPASGGHQTDYELADFLDGPPRARTTRATSLNRWISRKAG